MTNPEGFAFNPYTRDSDLDGGAHDQTLLNPEIDVPRLVADLGVTKADLRAISNLGLPSDVGVSSASLIKVTTVDDSLRIVQPIRAFNIQGDNVPSRVNEQPIGQQTIDGALNRLGGLVSEREAAAPGSSNTRVDFSVENGLFRVSRQPGNTTPTNRGKEGVLQFTEGADLTPRFDPDAKYEDRAVVAIRIPGYPVIVQVSPHSEAVHFPREAVLAAVQADGSLEQNTAGLMLANMGIVADKQNPHAELTADRPGGSLPRQDQMARAIIRGLLQLTHIGESRTQEDPLITAGNKMSSLKPERTIAIVGSFRKFLGQVALAHGTFTRHGISVSSPPSLVPINPGANYVRFPEDDPNLSDAEIQRHTEERIMGATAVYAVCVGGYIGPMTSYEIGRIVGARRPLYFSEEPTEPLIRRQAEGRIITPEALADLIATGNITPIIPIEA